MEKGTRNILIAIGASVAAYYLFFKKKKQGQTSSLPPVLIEEPKPIVEEPVLQEKPIENSIDSFIYSAPIVETPIPVAVATPEEAILPVFEEPKPIEQLTIEDLATPVEQYSIPSISEVPIIIQEPELPLESIQAPTIEAPIEAPKVYREPVMIGLVVSNDITKISDSQDRSLFYTSLDDWNSSSSLSGLTFYEDSELNNPINAKYIKKWQNNDTRIYEVNNGLVGSYVGTSVIDQAIVDNIMLSLENLYDVIDNNYTDSTNIERLKYSIDLINSYKPYNKFVITYLDKLNLTESDLSDSISEGQQYLNQNQNQNIEPIAIINDFVSDSTPIVVETTEVKNTEVNIQPIAVINNFVYKRVAQGGRGFVAANSIEELCNIKNNWDYIIPIYFEAINGIGTYGQIGYPLYMDMDLNIPYTDKTYITRIGGGFEILKIGNNGVVEEILPSC